MDDKDHTNLVNSSDEKSDEDEEFVQYNVVDSLKQSSKPILTTAELTFLNTYTYDKESVKSWRQVSDFQAIKECNEVKWSEISELIGKFHGYHNSLSLYRMQNSCSNSILVNTIERMICKNGCYYFPDKCFLAHGFDFKKLLEKSLHDYLNPHFKNLFKESQSKNVTLELEENGRPKLLKLAKAIGFNTVLDYDEEGLLKVDLSVFKEEFWKFQRPCFVREEKKILDIIHALLLSATKKREEEICLATQTYSQKLAGLNHPVLKVMCHGPDFGVHKYSVGDIPCDITEDEKKVRYTGFTSVEHKHCTAFEKKDHWEYKHNETDSKKSECCENKGLNLEGPASEIKSLTTFYPCNLHHCWISCRCKFCLLGRQMKCQNHTEHVSYNIKECIIQQSAQCQEHWIDHPDNFEFESGDIEIEKKVLFHNKHIKIDGRNYHLSSVKYAGLKHFCLNCKIDTNEHLSNHLAPHLQCKHCLYELKTIEDKSFWDKVCKTCGKIFFTAHSKNRHVKRHEMSKHECEICSITISSKSDLHRHMLEQHNGMQENHREIDKLECDACQKSFLTKGSLGRHVQGVHMQSVRKPLVCDVCKKSFKYLRNMKAHVYHIHEKQNDCVCLICGQNIKTSSNLKRHLAEKHKVINSDKALEETQPKNVFNCDVCNKLFSRRGNLDAHKIIHSGYKKHKCDKCGKQYSTVSNLNQHLQVHTDHQKEFQCNECQKTFLTKSNLERHVQGVHEHRIFSCDFCDKEYTRSDYLKAHKNKYHK
eukprot:GFUD01040132.1.p1 GENE.GFUD01040132.1~~GFUD01040132.1.p1  ORF type:complete len:761 (+),score=93.35 GFUD01040132.1:160-2442(+)